MVEKGLSAAEAAISADDELEVLEESERDDLASRLSEDR